MSEDLAEITSRYSPAHTEGDGFEIDVEERTATGFPGAELNDIFSFGSEMLNSREFGFFRKVGADLYKQRFSLDVGYDPFGRSFVAEEVGNLLDKISEEKRRDRSLPKEDQNKWKVIALGFTQKALAYCDLNNAFEILIRGGFLEKMDRETIIKLKTWVRKEFIDIEKDDPEKERRYTYDATRGEMREYIFSPYERRRQLISVKRMKDYWWYNKASNKAKMNTEEIFDMDQSEYEEIQRQYFLQFIDLFGDRLRSCSPYDPAKHRETIYPLLGELKLLLEEAPFSDEIREKLFSLFTNNDRNAVRIISLEITRGFARNQQPEIAVDFFASLVRRSDEELEFFFKSHKSSPFRIFFPDLRYREDPSKDYTSVQVEINLNRIYASGRQEEAKKFIRYGSFGENFWYLKDMESVLSEYRDNLKIQRRDGSLSQEDFEKRYQAFRQKTVDKIVQVIEEIPPDDFIYPTLQNFSNALSFIISSSELTDGQKEKVLQAGKILLDRVDPDKMVAFVTEHAGCINVVDTDSHFVVEGEQKTRFLSLFQRFLKQNRERIRK